MSGFYWLASYPKSGNTWLRLVLNSYRLGGSTPDFSQKQDFAPIASSRRRFDELLGVASSDLLPDELMTLRPRMYERQATEARESLFNKVHDAWQLTPGGEPLFPATSTLGAIYIVRDPRDVALSLAGHLGLSVDRAIDILLDERTLLCDQKLGLKDQLPQRLGSWSQHVLSWIDLPAPWSPLLLRYEDMLAKPWESFASVIKYCGWPLNDERLEQALDATRFDRLQAAEASHGFSERPQRAARFFREGRAGGWRERLNEAQLRRIEEASEPLRARLAYC